VLYMLMNIQEPETRVSLLSIFAIPGLLIAVVIIATIRAIWRSSSIGQSGISPWLSSDFLDFVPVDGSAAEGGKHGFAKAAFVA
jgi:hypothetical protein